MNQDNFSEIVKENISEFGLTIEEAVEDAKEQCRLQGLSLLEVVQDPSLYDDTGKCRVSELPVLKAVECLTHINSFEDIKAFTSALTTFSKECSDNLLNRCLANKYGAYGVLLNVLKSAISGQEIELTSQIIDALISFCNGQPDVIDIEGLDLLMNVIGSPGVQHPLLSKVIKLMHIICIKHEGNKCSIYDKGVVSRLKHFICEASVDGGVVIEICQLLKALVRDDDIRVEFGQGTERAKFTSSDRELLTALCSKCQEFSSRPDVLLEIFGSLSALITRDEVCLFAIELNLIEIVFQSIEPHTDSCELMKSCLTLFKSLSGNDSIKRILIDKGIADLIHLAMSKHENSKSLSEAGCSLIASLALRNPQQCSTLVDSHCHQSILHAMNIHQAHYPLQKSACMALRNLVARSQELVPTLLACNAEAMIKTAMSNHKNLNYEAKVALQALNVHVALKEEWTGTKGHLPS